MYRGTTPTLIFTLPFDCSNITRLNIAFAQNEVVILEKTLCDCNLEGKTISVTLTEEDTLMFDCRKRGVEIQLRIACSESRLASKIIETSVDRILKDGCLDA